MIWLLTAAVFLAAACQEPYPGPLVLAVGGAPSELAFWEELAADFQKTRRIPIELLRQPSDTDQRRQSLVVALSARQRDPDVFLMDVAWLGLFAASGWLEPLDGKIDTSPFFAKIVKTADMHQGRLMALPVYVDGGVLYYRKDLLAEYGYSGPPETWDALRKYAEHIQHRMRVSVPDFYGFVWQGAQYEGLICNLLEFAGTAGGFIFEEGRIRLNTAANRAAVDFMRDLIWRFQVSPPNTYTDMREEETRSFFQSGKALFERNWPYAWALHQDADSPVRGKVAICPLPTPSGAQGVSTLGGWHIGISAFSDRRSEALEFVRFVVSRETQKKLALRLGWNPGRSDLYDDTDIRQKAPHLPALKEVFRNAKPRPAIPYYDQFSRRVQRYVNAALAHKLDTAAALAGAQNEIDSLTDRYGGPASGKTMQ
jgi:multiple sugar transport system substrate-binding protein